MFDILLYVSWATLGQLSTNCRSGVDRAVSIEMSNEGVDANSTTDASSTHDAECAWFQPREHDCSCMC